MKLIFKPENRQEFIDFIDIYKNHIRASEGCHRVDFLNDIADENTFFTYSHWDGISSLEKYRNSELFSEVWNTVKPWFNSKPEAWSVEELFEAN